MGSAVSSVTGKGGGSTPQAPSAPDPTMVAKQQADLNNNSAAYNAALNNVNSSGPLGSKSYSITGYDPKTGAPIYGMTQSLSSGMQGVLNNAYSATANNLNPQGIDQNAANAAYNSMQGMIAPQQQQQTEALKAQMAAQGITDPGSQAFQQGTDNLARQQSFQNNNLANQATLTGIQAGQTAFNQNQAAQQQAVSNFTGLNGQNLASQSNGTNYATSAPNISQLYQNQYNAQMQAYNAQMAQQNNMNSGLFGLGASALMAPAGTFSGLAGMFGSGGSASTAAALAAGL